MTRLLGPAVRRPTTTSKAAPLPAVLGAFRAKLIAARLAPQAKQKLWMQAVAAYKAHLRALAKPPIPVKPPIEVQIAQNKFVDAGLNVVGSVFGDPELGSQVKALAPLVDDAARAIASVFSGDTHSPAELQAMTGSYAGVTVTPQVIQELRVQDATPLPEEEDDSNVLVRRSAR